MLTCSLKTIVTSDNPKRENERMSSMFGMLAIVCSTGNVISRSTSWAANVGVTVITITWLSVMSGTASIGSFVIEYEPQIIRANVNKPIINLLFIEK